MTSNATGGFGPHYNYGYDQGGAATGVKLPLGNVSSSQHSVVQVTDPEIVVAESLPDVKCGLILSALSAFFCGFFCGAVATLMAWKARLQILDRKYEHARQTKMIMWIFLGLALFFGLLIWIGGLLVPLVIILSQW